MSTCQVCGKGPKAGNNRSHSMRATKRTFKPNILNKNIDLGDGLKVRVRMCSKCHKTMTNKGHI